MLKRIIPVLLLCVLIVVAVWYVRDRQSTSAHNTDSEGGGALTSLLPKETGETSGAGNHAEEEKKLIDAVLRDLLSADMARKVSELPPDLRQRAEESFAAQHNNWLSIRRVSAKYRVHRREMKNGEWVDSNEKEWRTGTMDFEVVPLSPEEARMLNQPAQPLQLRWHTYDDETQWHAAAADAFGKPQKSTYWKGESGSGSSTTQPPVGPDGQRVPFLMNTLFKTVYAVIGASYNTDYWPGNAGYRSREKYFSELSPPLRLSSSEETENILAGEKSYLFLPCFAPPRVWFSVQTNDLHQVDQWYTERGIFGTERFQNYVEDPAGKLRFPSRILKSWTEGSGAEREGTEYTIELSDIRINPQLPAGIFGP